MKPDPVILVIGYGNSLRSDDGVGPFVAEAVEALRLPGVHTLICQQLSPEQLAEYGEKNFAHASKNYSAEECLGKVYQSLVVRNDPAYVVAAEEKRA